MRSSSRAFVPATRLAISLRVSVESRCESVSGGSNLTRLAPRNSAHFLLFEMRHSECISRAGKLSDQPRLPTGTLRSSPKSPIALAGHHSSLPISQILSSFAIGQKNRDLLLDREKPRHTRDTAWFCT